MSTGAVAATATKPEKVYKFRILQGRHAIGKKIDGTRQVFSPGSNDVFETTSDLRKMNEPGARPKFELISIKEGDKEEFAPHQENDGLDDLTISELKKLAEEEEVDLGKATRKDEILSILRRNR